jgi:transposase-like protein
MPPKRRSFTTDVKLQAVRRVEVDKLPIKQVARELSVEPVRIREWLKNKVDIQAPVLGLVRRGRSLVVGGCQ